jgi:predicted nucleotidyltransferase
MFEKVFPEMVKEIFGTNLRFAYCFGSFAAGRDRRVSDIDTLVCVDHVREEEAVRYLEWLIELHHFFGKVIDFTYPMELMSVSDLSETLARLKSYKVNADQNPSWVYDALIWGHSLAGPKIAVINPHNIPEDWLTYMHTEQMRLMRKG